MKKILFVFILGVVASCSFKTNEEKARALIEPMVKSDLVIPDSYEFLQLTLDCCFSDNDRLNPDMIQFSIDVSDKYEDYKHFLKEAEKAESNMTYYDRPYSYQSSHDKLKKKQYMDERYKAQLKAADAKEKILQLYKDNMKLFLNSESAEHTFTGWAATFSYRAETAGGKKRVCQDTFFLDKNLTKVTHQFSQYDILKLTYSGLEDLQYDLGEELNELFEGHEFEE